MTKRTRKADEYQDHRDGRYLLALCVMVILVYGLLLHWWIG